MIERDDNIPPFADLEAELAQARQISSEINWPEPAVVDHGR
jgi:uncharacterized protein (UPF0276 family)